jgi:hypothetical protein
MRKNVLSLAAISMFVASCSTSVKQIGSVNMLSHRNVNQKLDYQVLSTYAGGSPKERKQSRSVTIEDAIDQLKDPATNATVNALFADLTWHYPSDGFQPNTPGVLVITDKGARVLLHDLQADDLCKCPDGTSS